MTEINQDVLWDRINREVSQLQASEISMSTFLQKSVLDRKSFVDALAHIISDELFDSNRLGDDLEDVILQPLFNEADIGHNACADLLAHYSRDAACDKYFIPLLFFKGFQALQLYRIAHHYWCSNQRQLALLLQHCMVEVFHVDIHPAAVIGAGIMMDHATGIIVGETAVIGNNVSILHGVTLGGNGCSTGKRHPSVCDGVMISAGATLIGDISIGEHCKIGAGSLVLNSVPAHVTAVGVPAYVVGTPPEEIPAFDMNQHFTR
jgi:serine O-acetyltransferase